MTKGKTFHRKTEAAAISDAFSVQMSYDHIKPGTPNARKFTGSYYFS